MLDLISKRAALEAIQKAYDKVEVPKEGGDNLLESQVACGVKVGAENALLAVMDVPSPWVSVNDRLPDKEGDYLCYYDHNGNITIRYCYENDAEGFATSGFTHWMELPAPPSNWGGAIV